MLSVDFPRYKILETIPHQRVANETPGAKEIFDLYRLGIFTVPDADDEILELVELQPDTNYRKHFHRKSSAVIYIVSGKGRLLIGKHSLEYHPGVRVSIPAEVPHGFQTKTRTLFLSIQSPPILDPENGSLDLQYGDQDELN